MKPGTELIREERVRQITVEGFGPDHDAEHFNGSLAGAAAVYAAVAREQALGDEGPFLPDPILWLWKVEWFKPRDQLSNLVRAGALIAAEIDRVQRAPSLAGIDTPLTDACGADDAATHELCCRLERQLGKLTDERPMKLARALAAWNLRYPDGSILPFAMQRQCEAELKVLIGLAMTIVAP